MKQWNEIRHKVLVEKVSKRQIRRDYRIGSETLEKILANPEPPGYRQSTARPKPKLGEFIGAQRSRTVQNLRTDRAHRITTSDHLLAAQNRTSGVPADHKRSRRRAVRGMTPLITTTPQTITQWATNPGQLENDRLSSGN